MRPDLLKLFVISEVRLKPGGIQPLLLRLISDSPNYSGVLESADRPSTLVEELLEKFVLTEVTRPGSSGYNGSIAIGKQFFRVGLLQARNTPYKGHKRLALAYPSVYAPEICNVPTYNIAMHPETFDACFSVTKADVYSLTHDISSNRLVLISHNTGAVCSNGEIAWQHSYEEMIGRTKNGIFGLGIREERIKGVADLM